MRLFLATAAMFVGIATAANAQVAMGSAPAYGGPSQSLVVCYYVNVGSTPLNISNSQIFAEPGVPVAEISETCGGPIAAGQRCRTVSVSPIAAAAHWCRLSVSAKANIRGRAEFRSSTGNIVTTQNIQ